MINTNDRQQQKTIKQCFKGTIGKIKVNYFYLRYIKGYCNVVE